jgi:hypothetical protein
MEINGAWLKTIAAHSSFLSWQSQFRQRLHSAFSAAAPIEIGNSRRGFGCTPRVFPSNFLEFLRTECDQKFPPRTDDESADLAHFDKMAWELKSSAGLALTLLVIIQAFSFIHGYCGGFKKECETCTNQRFDNTGHLITKLTNVAEKKVCAKKCLKLVDCQSFNFNAARQECELNNAITNSLKTDSGWDYFKKVGILFLCVKRW